jgi:hypothetical protein
MPPKNRLTVYKEESSIVYFQLSSSLTLKALLAKIPFDTSINPSVLEHLKRQVKNETCIAF